MQRNSKTPTQPAPAIPPAPTYDPNDKNLDRGEAAELLGVSISFLAVDATKTAKGKPTKHNIPFFKIGSRCVYSRNQLLAWKAAHQRNAFATVA